MKKLAFQGGSYSLTLTAIVLAILIVVNMLVSALPTSMTRYDISYNDIYLAETDMTSYQPQISFDGEGAITSAIDYVTNEDQPQVYMLEGHGEDEIPETFREQLTKENVELESLSLLNVDEVPEEADCIFIYAPSSDISAEEKGILEDYVADGGKLMVMAGPTEDGKLENLYGLLADYGVESQEGIVVEGDRQYYAFQAPHILLPTIEDSEMTAPLIEGNYYTIVPAAQGMTVGDTGEAVVTELLTTSASSFNKEEGYAIASFEKEEGDVDGPFAVALSIMEDGEQEDSGQIVWISSSNFIDDMYNAYSSGANLEFTMNALSSMIGENEAVAIRSKSLNYNYLTISESTASTLKTIMIAVIPLSYLAIGVIMVLKRRMRNEAI